MKKVRAFSAININQETIILLINSTANSISLIKSQLTNKGPIYTKIQKFNLQKYQ